MRVEVFKKAPMSRFAAAVAGVLLMTAMLVSFSPAPTAVADTGSSSNCEPGSWKSNTNDWQAFAFHEIRAHFDGCINAKCNNSLCWWYWAWTNTPKISYPTTVPFPTTESIETVSGPYVADIRRGNGPKGNGISAVKYEWTAHQCAGPSGVICQNFQFSAWYTYGGSRLCFVGGACDDKKAW